MSQQTVTRCLERAAEFGMLAALDDRARTGREATITAEARTWLVGLACAKAHHRPCYEFRVGLLHRFPTIGILVRLALRPRRSQRPDAATRLPPRCSRAMPHLQPRLSLLVKPPTLHSSVFIVRGGWLMISARLSPSVIASSAAAISRWCQLTSSSPGSTSGHARIMNSISEPSQNSRSSVSSASRICFASATASARLRSATAYRHVPACGSPMPPSTDTRRGCARRRTTSALW